MPNFVFCWNEYLQSVCILPDIIFYLTQLFSLMRWHFCVKQNYKSMYLEHIWTPEFFCCIFQSFYIPLGSVTAPYLQPPLLIKHPLPLRHRDEEHQLSRMADSLSFKIFADLPLYSLLNLLTFRILSSKLISLIWFFQSYMTE